MAFTLLVESPKAGLHAALNYLLTQDNQELCSENGPVYSKNNSAYDVLADQDLKSSIIQEESAIAQNLVDCISMNPSICDAIPESNRGERASQTISYATQCLFLRPLLALKNQRGMIEVEERWTTKKHLLERVGIKYLSDSDILAVLCHLHLSLDPIKCVLIELNALHENLKFAGQKTVWEIPALAATIPGVELVIVIDPQTQLDWTKAPCNLNRMHISV